MKSAQTIEKLHAGDSVAVLAPSSGLAAAYPYVYKLGLQRLEEVFGLNPVEFPSTTMAEPSPEQRAEDINTAFADTKIKGVFTTIGGTDQISVLKYVDEGVLRNNPKPFFGYSDNTNFMQLLWRSNITAYYGGALMTQFAMQGGMHDMTVASLKYAMFEHGPVKVAASPEFTDIDLDWADQANLNGKRQMEANDGWYWDGDGHAEGILWGGCVETMVVQLASDIYLPSADQLKNLVIFLETAENIPEHWITEYVLVGLGERGILKQAKAVLFGRPKTWQLQKQLDAETRQQYKSQQRATVIDTVRRYNQQAIIVQNMDFGHTDPQIIVPASNQAVVDAEKKEIIFNY